MNILLPGLYPRSESLVALTRDVDRRRAAADALTEAWRSEALALLALQRDVPFPSTGLYRWQDLLRPWTALLPGARAGGLMRFFETNTFWRRLECHGAATAPAESYGRWIKEYFFSGGLVAEQAPQLFTLPFLFLFKEYSSGLSLPQIAALLEEAAVRLLAYPNKALCFCEPTFGWRALTDEERHAAFELLHRLKRRCDAPIYLWSFFFPLDGELDYLFGLPADGFGVDFYANDAEAVLRAFPPRKLLLAGLLNTETTLVESRALLESFMGAAAGRLSSERIFVTPNGPAELLPKEVMDKKVINAKELCACWGNSFSPTR